MVKKPFSTRFFESKIPDSGCELTAADSNDHHVNPRPLFLPATLKKEKGFWVFLLKKKRRSNAMTLSVFL